MTDEGIRYLCAGIVKQAIMDYIWVLNHEGKSIGGYSKVGLEKFFRSGEFQAICKMDSEYIISVCRKEKSRWQRKNGLNVGSGSFLRDRVRM